MIKKDISANLYQKCFILCSKILLIVLYNLGLLILFQRQHTWFQTSPILKVCLATRCLQFSYLQMVLDIDPFQSDVTSRDFAKWMTSIKTNRMCPRTDLKVILKFSRNSELLCGAWHLLKSFQQREGQRILSYSRNLVQSEAQEASF